MKNHPENTEKQIYAEALRKASHDYEELIREFSILRLLNDSIQIGLGFTEICQKLVQFITEMMNVENASVMVLDEDKGELKLLVAKGLLDDSGTLYADSRWSGKTFKVGEGIAGKAVAERKSILINDTLRDPRFVRDGTQKVSIRSILSIPLIHEYRVHGVLNISNSEPGAFTHRKEHALSIIASTASVAMSYALAVEQLKRVNSELHGRNKELGAVVALSELLHANLELDEVLDESLQRILEAIDVSGAAIFIVEGDATVALKSSTARSLKDLSSVFAILNRSFGSEIMASAGIFHRSGASGELIGNGCPLPDEINIAGIPLFSGEQCMGILMTVDCRSGPMAKEEEKLLISFGNQIGMAIHNCRLISHLRENILELRETRRKLIQSDKLALLGEMLSSVAHEVNNPLAAIQGYSDLLRSDQSVTAKQKKMLDKIVLCVDRTRKIVQGLLSFARKTELQKAPAKVHELIERAIEHREHDFRLRSFTITREFVRGEPIALVDMNQIEQVFLNLINNAYDSMTGRESGDLTITTRLVNDGAAIEIAFADTGPGVPEGNVQKIFEPFFTTKEIGKGTGLGLSISYGIIQEHGGMLFLDERYQRGARFVVCLPVTDEQSYSDGGEQQLDGSEAAAQKGRVLIVDDEEVVLDFLETALRAEGFAVECASTGDEAFERLKEKSFDLIISDIKMPGRLDGRRLFHIFTKEKPEMANHFVFISGDIMESETSRFLEESGRPFLLKPFSMKDLRQVISKTLRPLLPKDPS